MSTVISRMELDHPDQGDPGGTTQFNKLRAIYQTIGDNVDSRYFELNDMAIAATADFDHNFKCPLDKLRVKIWDRVEGTGELTLADQSQYTVTATPGNLTTQVRVQNDTGGEVDISVTVVHAPFNLGDADNYDISGGESVGDVPLFDGTKYTPGVPSITADLETDTTPTGDLTVNAGKTRIIDGYNLQVAQTMTLNGVLVLLGSDVALDGDVDLGVNGEIRGLLP